METKVMFCGGNGDKRKATRYNRAAAGGNVEKQLGKSNNIFIRVTR
jgi:hypothetical protein